MAAKKRVKKLTEEDVLLAWRWLAEAEARQPRARTEYEDRLQTAWLGLLYPYAETHIVISGYDARKYKRVQDRIVELLIRCETVDKWVQEIPNSGDRTIITMHYIEGYSWQEVGQRLGLLRDVVRRRARRRIKNFCTASEKSPKVPFSPL